MIFFIMMTATKLCVRTATAGHTYRRSTLCSEKCVVPKKAIPNEETIRLLQESKRGVLAVAGDDDYPYAVPVNYYYDADAGKIYFHSSLAGHKVDAMKRNPKICFTVYGEPEIKDLD